MSEPQYDGQDMHDYYGFQELRECRRTLRQLRERIEKLPRHLLWRLAEGFQEYRRGYDADDEYVKVSDMLAILNSQQEKS